MGSLKDEMRGVSEDRLLREKAEDGEHPGSSDGTSVTEGEQINTGEKSITCEDKPKIDYNKERDGKDNDISLKADNFNSVALDRQSISVAVPSTPDPTDPRSPAPFGQHHIRTQVSLEVVQCCSAATSPMTPPEGSHSFFFPSSFGRVEAVGTDTKDAELQVGQQVEFCSVATSPMTPKTPFFCSFPPVPGKEAVQNKNEESQSCQLLTKNPAESESEISGALKLSSSKELKSEDLSSGNASENPANCPASTVMNLESKQQRMGSMDQDITILVTQHGNTEEEEEEEEEDKDKTQTTVCSIEPEMVKLEEEDEESEDGQETAVESENSKSTIKTEEASSSAQVNTELKSVNSLEAQESKDLGEELSLSKPAVPESPAPFGCHNMRTQVSLEVVQCHSAATSPMTPPEGDQAFCFPSTLTKCGAVGTETKDAELQVGHQVEFRSVATAPMTPRTPTATTFPDIQKGTSIEEKIVEEEEEKEATEQEDDGEKEEAAGEEKQTLGKDTEDCNDDDDCKEDKCEEPVQEVSWDEKGMTWEVYGAVVEVSVLGSAIQKHLEKQVKKQKRQPTMPPPPPLNPSATPLTSEPSPRGSGSGKGRGGKRSEGKASRRRRNPFRLMMENMQQPHCCSRAHTTE